jgi:hypothetical protein
VGKEAADEAAKKDKINRKGGPQWEHKKKREIGAFVYLCIWILIRGFLVIIYESARPK